MSVLKKMGWLVAGLFFSLAVCRGQSLDRGWMNADASVIATEVTNVVSFGGGGGSPVSYPAIAEANTPEIQALARGLENDPKRIFDYVHDHIRHVLYFGAKKGAQLTLLERSGNDFDQCALLVSLLQAAGYSPAYEFGILEMPYDSPDHKDIHHWLTLSLVNTNWSSTKSYMQALLGSRGYPNNAFFTFTGDTNTMAFHRVWVKLAVSTNTYYLDPAFKTSEPIAGIDLHSAMGLDTNVLVTASGGTSTTNYAQNLNEFAVRTNLLTCTTNLLAYLQANYPNSSVEQVLGSQQITSSSGQSLNQLLPTTYTVGGQAPVVDWSNEPTNMMSILTLTFAGTNAQWFIPALQGQRLTLTFDSNGLAQLWQEDSLLVQTQTTGGFPTVNVSVNIDHPFGSWDFTHNTLIDGTLFDQNDPGTTYQPCQRTNATYAMLYAFEMDDTWLKKRQAQLDAYRQQGYSNTSRQVVSETLNIMGLNWLLQTELMEQIFGTQMNMITQWHHRLGRMAQENANGYYVDVYLQLSGVFPATGKSSADAQRQLADVDLNAYFESATEHGVIEQMQSSNMVAASTVKMLELGNTNGFKTFLLNSNNWSAFSTQLTNYQTADLDFLYFYITNNFNLLVPANGAQHVAGAGSWGGYGVVGIGFPGGLRASAMIISGAYFGGYDGNQNAAADADYAAELGQRVADAYSLSQAFTFLWSSGDPVNMVDGTFSIAATDLALGQTEPRGLHVGRYYSPARRNDNLVGMADGWIHNYYFNASAISDPRANLGNTTPQQMAAMLVAARAALELYNTQPDPKNWLLTALIAKWGIDQLNKTAISVSLGNDTLEFVRQPDGSFTPPANCMMTLIQSNSLYSLQERHGRTFNFAASGSLSNIVDQYTNVSLALTYNTSNWVSTAKDWKNRQLTFNYTGSPQRLTSVTDGTRTVNYLYKTTYNTQGDLVAVVDAEGKTNSFVYDSNHQIVATVNALGQLVSSNIYDGFGRVVTQYSQGDTNKMWQFLWSGPVNVSQDPAGSKSRFFYDDKFRPTGAQDALGNLNQTFYDGQNHVVMTVSPLNETNQALFDSQHNVIFTVDPLGFTNQFVYDTQNNLIESIDARSNPSHFGYNAHFQLTGSTNGAGDTVTSSYNSGDGTLASRTDSGGTTTYGYDGNGLQNLITYPNSLGSEGFSNNAYGDLLFHTNGRTFVTSFQYNLRRELTNSIAPTNLTTKIVRDAVGNVFSETDARGTNTTYTWSPTRKLQATILPTMPQGIPVITNIYDARDWLARTLDPLLNPTQSSNDVAGRPIFSIDPLLRTNSSGYDADGRRIASTNGAQEFTLQGWSSRGDLLQTTNNQLKTISRGYDPAGNQILLTNRNGKIWQFQFDAANRLTNTITPLTRQTKEVWNNRGLLQSIIQPSTHSNLLVYDARGRLATNSDSVGTRTFVHDADNNLATNSENGQSLTRTFDAYDRVLSYTDANGFLIQYRYDLNGNLTSLIYPGGRTVTYTYDGLNRLTSVTDWASRLTTNIYDLAGRITSITRPNGTVRNINYDAAGQATNVVEKTTGNFPIEFWKLQFDNAGRVQWEFGAPLPHTNPPPSRTLTYDDDNRLATVNSVSVTNDPDGNMVYGPLTNGTFVTYGYDARNRLLSAGSLNYGYDVTGNRTIVTNGANSAIFVVNPNTKLPQVLMRIENSGVTNYYVYGVGLLYEVTETATNTSTACYHFDSRGSTVAMTDANANITDRMEYSAYGTMTYHAGTNDTPFLYNGRYGVQSDANGLLFMRARYYNPYLCRFINPDPSGFAGGLNWYAYADGNPVSEIDPFGLGASFADINPGWIPTDGYVDPFGQSHETFCMSCHDNTPAGDFYKQQAVLANMLDWKVLAYQQVLGFGLSFGAGAIAEDMAAAQQMEELNQIWSVSQQQAGEIVDATKAAWGGVSATGMAAGNGPLNPGWIPVTGEGSYQLAENQAVMGLMQNGQVIAMADPIEAEISHAQMAQQVGIQLVDGQLPRGVEGFLVQKIGGQVQISGAGIANFNLSSGGSSVLQGFFK